MTKQKILIVDDGEIIRMLLEIYLQKIYEVHSFNNGLDGLKWLQKGNLIDLIICDINMPQINGYEFLTNIRCSGYFSNIPIMMLTGVNSHEEKIKCLKLGADDYIVKPFDPDNLLLRIKNSIGSRKK